MGCIVGSSYLVRFDFISWHSSPIKIIIRAPSGSFAKSVHWTLSFRSALRKIFRKKKKDSWNAGCGANAVKVFEENTTCVFIKNRRRTLVRWRFFSKPAGPDLYSNSAAGDGNNRYLLTFFDFFWLQLLCKSFVLKCICPQVIASKNAVAFRRAAWRVERRVLGQEHVTFGISACHDYVENTRLAEFLLYFF